MYNGVLLFESCVEFHSLSRLLKTVHSWADFWMGGGRKGERERLNTKRENNRDREVKY